MTWTASPAKRRKRKKSHRSMCKQTCRGIAGKDDEKSKPAMDFNTGRSSSINDIEKTKKIQEAKGIEKNS